MKLFIAVPSYGEVIYSVAARSLFKLGFELGHRGHAAQVATLSYADIADSRNLLLTSWFDKTDASHLLFVDADMGFEPQLILDMIDFDQPVVGSIYPKRIIDLGRFAKEIAAGQSVDKANAAAHDYVVRKPRPRSTAQNGFLEVEGCGTGIFLIQRS